MFLIRSLILSREVFFVNRDYRKLSHISRLQRFVHARTLVRCLRKKICEQIVLLTDSVVFCYLYFFST